MILRKIVGVAVRFVGYALSGWLVIEGYFDDQTAKELFGALGTLSTVGWSVWEKWRMIKRQRQLEARLENLGERIERK